MQAYGGAHFYPFSRGIWKGEGGLPRKEITPNEKKVKEENQF